MTTILRFRRAGRTINICLGMALTDSRTAEGEVKTIDERVFNRLRIWLAAWRDVHISEYGADDPGLKCIPDPEGLNWHRLAEGGIAMSDACAQAQKMSRVIEEKVLKTY